MVAEPDIQLILNSHQKTFYRAAATKGICYCMKKKQAKRGRGNAVTIDKRVSQPILSFSLLLLNPVMNRPSIPIKNALKQFRVD